MPCNIVRSARLCASKTKVLRLFFHFAFSAGQLPLPVCHSAALTARLLCITAINDSCEIRTAALLNHAV